MNLALAVWLQVLPCAHPWICDVYYFRELVQSVCIDLQREIVGAPLPCTPSASSHTGLVFLSLPIPFPFTVPSTFGIFFTHELGWVTPPPSQASSGFRVLCLYCFYTCALVYVTTEGSTGARENASRAALRHNQ